MKIIIKSVLIAAVLSVIISMLPFSAQCDHLTKEVFRLHILADNDTREAQSLKLKVRDAVLKKTEKLYKSADNLSEAIRLTDENLSTIADTAKKTLAKNGCSYPVKAEIKRMYFNTRYYGRVTMPSGFYDALRITIGEGKGHNWWCVMYPSLCVGASADYNELKDRTSDDEYRVMTEDGYEFKFKVIEYFKSFCSLFS
ncbi:MAG: stage II sporulation protein R [Ruminococcus sp.]|nr:stage II sporulation protein R [Ruminococcus sp.]